MDEANSMGGCFGQLDLLRLGDIVLLLQFVHAIYMTDFLSHYLRLEPPTWVFLSTFLAIGLFLMFHRFWSLRNLDIVLILLFTPGLVMVYEGSGLAPQDPPAATGTGEIAGATGDRDAAKKNETNLESARPSETVLTAAGDTIGTPAGPVQGEASSPSKPIQPPIQPPLLSTMPSPVNTTAQTPEMEAFRNSISSPGLLYLGYLWLIIIASLLVVRMLLDTAIVRRPMLDPNLSSGGMLFLGVSMLVYMLINVAVSEPTRSATKEPPLGPGYILMKVLPNISTVPVADSDSLSSEKGNAIPSKFKLLLSRSMSISANLVIVLSIVAIGYWHFGNFKTGVGAATFYLLLPYAAYMTGRVDHVVPGALLLLAILLYRQPFAAGLCLGCAAGVVYYPFSLLPLWCSFYWQRGIRRFSSGFMTSILALVIAMIFLYPDMTLKHLGDMFGVKQIAMTSLDGIWGLGWYPVMRLPLILLFILLSVSFVAWPAQKSLATLMSCSAALMAATQCWHGFGGGLYLAWFVPLALLTIFRPNLDYCVALEVVRPRRKKTMRVTPAVENANAA